MNKTIYALSHFDFDGVTCPFIIHKLCQELDMPCAITIKYCDFYDINHEIEKFINLVSNLDDLKEIFFIYTDLAYFTKENSQKLHSLFERGMNILHIDHHISEESLLVDKNCNWSINLKEIDLCASLGLYTLLASHIGHNIKCDIALLKDKITNTIDGEKIKNFSSFFNNLIECKYYNKLNTTMDELYNLAVCANLVDHNSANKKDGLKEILTYWDLQNEYCDKNKNELLQDVSNIISNLSASMAEVVETNNMLIKIKKYNERIQESMDSLNIYSVYGYDKKRYSLCCTFGEADICFIVDGFRKYISEILKKSGINDIEVDAFISFSKVSVSQECMYHIRPVSFEDAMEFFDITKIDNILNTNGTKIGVKGLYDKEIYNDIATLRQKSLHAEDMEKEHFRKCISDILTKELEKIFYRVEKTR